MAISLEEAKALQPGDMLHHVEHKNFDGSCQRWKVNGKPQTWKRNASRVRVPVKHGLRDYDQLYEYELNQVYLATNCPRCKG
jgi:hypothetical protein